MRTNRKQLAVRRETLRHFGIREIERIRAGKFEGDPMTMPATCGCETELTCELASA